MNTETVLPEAFSLEDRSLISAVVSLPQRILAYHNLEGLTDLVLHELAHEECFGFKQALYLVDNPDFDQLVGRAAAHEDECEDHKKNMWETPKSFAEDVGKGEFHRKVRGISEKSFTRGVDDNNAHIKQFSAFGSDLGMEHPHAIVWNIKHANRGVLLFEKRKELTPWHMGVLSKVVALLGLTTS